MICMRDWAIREFEKVGLEGSPYWAVREPMDVPSGRLWVVIDRRYDRREAERIAREMCAASEATKQ